MKKLIAVLFVLLMLSSFATFANAEAVYCLGDTDKSGSEPAADDLVYLKKVLLGTAQDLGMSNVNEDENGDVNILDLVCLKKLIANPSSGVVISNGDSVEIIDNWN